MKAFCTEAYYMIFSTLANRTRLAIIDVLKDEPKTISELSKALQQGEKIISENISLLVKCALVLPEGSRKKQAYCINMEILEPLSEILEFHVDKYCPDFSKCVPLEKLKGYLKEEAAKTTYIEHE